MVDGLDTSREVPGTLSGWLRSGRGDWIGRVRFEIAYLDPGTKPYPVTEQLVPAYALRPRAVLRKDRK